MPAIQPVHLILILIIALVIFGPSRLPELGKSLGKSIMEFKSATKDMTDTLHEATSAPAEPRATTGAAVASRPVEPSSATQKE